MKKSVSVIHVLCAVLVLGALIFHALQIQHDHPGVGGYGGSVDAHADTHNHAADPAAETIDDSFHAIEKKLFLVLLLMLIGIGATKLFWSLWSPRAIKGFLDRCAVRDVGRNTSHPQSFSYLVVLFATGALHPKLH